MKLSNILQNYKQLKVAKLGQAKYFLTRFQVQNISVTKKQSSKGFWKSNTSF